ncbi:MAG: cytochrome B [Alteromonadaceae bacterium]|nr:MAG: cytochrome B [Alteromonadaceae bacterium]
MPINNRPTHWGWLAVLMHWSTALCVFGLFTLGLWMTGLDYYSPWYKQGPWIHKSIGVLLLLLTLLRLFMRLSLKAPLPLESHKSGERMAAKATHMLLYALILIIIMSGYLISTADGRSIEVFSWFSVPATITITGIQGEAQEELAGSLHWYSACILMGLVGLHILGALKHHIVDKDTTLLRMLRPYANKVIRKSQLK